MASIPIVDASPLFGAPGPERDAADAQILAGAGGSGFLMLVFPGIALPLGGRARGELLRIFDLDPEGQRRLWRRLWAPENSNAYRGWFPIQGGVIKEGFDLGPDRPGAFRAGGDILAEPTPLPAEEALPGWRAAMRTAFDALERVGAALMRSLARGMGLAEDAFEAAFRDGNSTLRLIAYPPWPERAEAYGVALRPHSAADGARRYDIGGEHVDSGLVTLLQQDEVGGLQARVGDTWVDVPVVEETLVVNFGRLLERWTAGRIRATEHRVLGGDVRRHSIPFFYEPRIDARIAPLPLAGAEPFPSFTYGDHVWAAMTRFPEFANLERWSGVGSGPGAAA